MKDKKLLLMSVFITTLSTNESNCMEKDIICTSNNSLFDIINITYDITDSNSLKIANIEDDNTGNTLVQCISQDEFTKENINNEINDVIESNL